MAGCPRIRVESGSPQSCLVRLLLAVAVSASIPTSSPPSPGRFPTSCHAARRCQSSLAVVTTSVAPNFPSGEWIAARADYMGMLGTVMNCLALQDFLERQEGNAGSDSDRDGPGC